jgi:hypothetical protein
MNFDSSGALILRWPGVTKPGVVDRARLVSTLDFTPTLLDAAALPPLPGVDGRSFLPALKGGTMPGWDGVFTFYNAAFGNNWLPMRSALPALMKRTGDPFAEAFAAREDQALVAATLKKVSAA